MLPPSPLPPATLESVPHNELSSSLKTCPFLYEAHLFPKIHSQNLVGLARVAWCRRSSR